LLYSIAESINNAGEVVGYSYFGGYSVATEWSGGSVINLGGLHDFGSSEAYGINDAGQIVGSSDYAVPEPSTWTMMLAGFASLGLAGYRRAKATSGSARAKANRLGV
jgi:uncharacterized membrane protein